MNFGKSENVTVNMDRETGDIEVFAAKPLLKMLKTMRQRYLLKKHL